jgi:hypothetical protein
MVATREAPNVLLPARLLAAGDGYAMVKRPGTTTFPFVVAEHEWAEAPVQQRGTD